MKRAPWILLTLALVVGRVGQVNGGSIAYTTATAETSVPLSYYGTMPHEGYVTQENGAFPYQATSTVLLNDHIPMPYSFDELAYGSGYSGDSIRTPGFLTLGVTAQVDTNIYARAEGAASWRDTITVSGGAGKAMPAYLNFNFFVDGSVTVQPDAISGRNDWLYAGFSLSGPGNTISVNETYWEGNYYLNGQQSSIGINGTLHDLYSFSTPLNDGFAIWVLAADAQAFADSGLAWSSFSDTVQLQSMTLPDGNTPESEGYTLTFGSGLTSPNLQPSVATPEPASLTLLGIGAICLLGYGWRRRRQSA